MRRGLKRLVALAVALVALMAVSAPAAPAQELRVSSSPDRSSDIPLEGATLSGRQYVFVPDASGIDRVRFWLDDPERSGSPRQTENTAPWDFAGGSTTTANAFDVTTVVSGVHTITAEILTTTGTQEVISAQFVTEGEAVAPEQVHLSWTADPATTMTVTWRTLGELAEPAVRFRAAGATGWQEASGAIRPSGATGKQYEATLTGLEPATVYEYQVPGDGGAWSEVLSTRTAPAPGPATFDAVYFADTGLIGRTDGLATGTAQVIKEIAALDPLFTLPGGDYAYYDTDKRFGSLEATIDEWFRQQEPVLSRAPAMPTLGNHEVLLGESLTDWQRRFATPPRSPDGANYSFDVGDVHFVSILAVAETAGLSTESLEWIEQDIAAAKARGLRWIVPYMHVPAFSDGSSHPSNLELRRQLGPLFERLDVDLVLSSHDQNYERTYPLRDVPATNTPTSTSRTCYTQADGVTWVKVSPAGKLSNKNGDFSKFTTATPPHYIAFRDDTRHHFGRLRLSPEALRFEAFAVVGDGSTPVVQDAFEIRTDDTCPDEPPPPEPPPPADPALAVSSSADRSSPVALEGATLSDKRYVFVDPGDGLDRVRFWIDDPDMSGTPTSTENTEPWDLAGGTTTTANAFDTASLADGPHTLTARLEALDGTVTTIGATFTTDNDTATEPAPAPSDGLVVSSSPDRADPLPLGGATLSAKRYVFLQGDSDISQVRFWIDDPEMTGTPRQTENTAPWDLAGGTVAAANAFDTATLADGTHTITAAVKRTDGTTTIVTETFTVDNP